LPLSPELLSRLETLRLESRRRFLGMRKGAHPSPRRGTSLEFADYRSYTPGDDPRHVDWGLYSRTRRLYTRLYQEEEDLNAYIFVDTSASMTVPAEDGKDTAVTNLALALAYAVLSSDDSVRLLRLTGERSEATPFYRGRRRILEIHKALERSRPTDRLALVSAIASGLRTIRRPGKAILLSDLLFPIPEIERSLDLLRAANLDILVIQILGATEIDPPLTGPERIVDIETGESRDLHFDETARRTYLENLDRHTREIRSLCHRAGIQFTRFDTSRDLATFVLAELPTLGLFH
jgi:uncharacterized protein (DUF58 family)